MALRTAIPPPPSTESMMPKCSLWGWGWWPFEHGVLAKISEDRHGAISKNHGRDWSPWGLSEAEKSGSSPSTDPLQLRDQFLYINQATE